MQVFAQQSPGLLDARARWKDAAAYDRAAEELSARFRKNFENLLRLKFS